MAKDKKSPNTIGKLYPLLLLLCRYECQGWTWDITNNTSLIMVAFEIRFY